jgi:sugar phosphate isomerase/epimerase
VPDACLCWGTVESVDLLTLADAAAAAGFPTISVTPAMALAALAEAPSPAALARQVAERGVRVALVDPLMRGLPGCPAPDDVAPRFRSTFLAGEDDCYRVAEVFGARTLNVAHYMGAPTPVSALVDAIGAVARRAAGHGIGVLVEFMPEGSIPDLATAVAIVEGIAAPNVGVMLDTWHLYRTGDSIEAVRAAPPGSVHGLQLSDAAAETFGTGVDPPSRDRLQPGDGVIPIGEIVREVRRHVPDVFVGLEVLNRTFAERPPADRARAAAEAVTASGVLAGP